MSKLVATGAAGFIGFHACKSLLERGDEVIAVDNLNDYYDPQLKLDCLSILRPHTRFRFHKRDVSEGGAISQLFAAERPSVVINVAAQAGVRYSTENPHAYVDSNLVGFVNVLEACRHQQVEHL